MNERGHGSVGVSSALTRELRCTALRHAVWLGLLHAGELGFTEIETQLLHLLVAIDLRRQALEDADAPVL